MTEVQQVPVVPVESRRPPQQALRPHRGGLILALSILGLVSCFICGIIAWIMGNNDLKEMEAGTMDLSGRGRLPSRICGMVSVILPVAVIYLWLLMVILIGAGSALLR